MSGSPSAPARDEADIAGRMAGEYRLGRKLGEGGFGTVYEAEHPLLKRRAAVKVLHRVADRDSEAVQRFVSEAQAVNQVRTRHIVDIFSFGKLADGRHFYVMDLLDGEALDQRLASAGKLDVATVVQILRPIAEALDRAHAAGIVHRDLKPQNIFLSWDASGVTVPVLLDFGVAKLLGDSTVQTVSGTPIGTPLYMSPEQARGEKVDGRADVYALGVVCHELLTGEPPITGETTIAVLMAHIVNEPPRVSALRPDLPAAIDAPILQMLAKAPSARPATAGEALQALAAAAEASGITIPADLPRLSRPEPRAPTPRPGELSNTVEWAERNGSPDAGEARAQPSAASTAPTANALRWPWIVVLVVLGSVATYLFVSANMRNEVAPLPRTEASKPAVVAPEPQPAPSTPPQAVPPTPVEQIKALPVQPTAPAETQSKRKKRPARDKIPSDLESPF